MTTRERLSPLAYRHEPDLALTRHPHRKSVCPHDCPSACAIEVDIRADGTIGRLRGQKQNTYTDGVICAKVARYAERNHHPDRLLYPLIRVGAKGAGQWRRASWDEALDLVAARFREAEQRFGPETVWLNFYAGTMGQVQRDGINRLRHAKGYSNQFDSFCTNMAWTGYAMGTGSIRGADPREMAKSDCVVIWGTNAVSTQVNVMTHAMKARKERGAKIVAIDIYQSPTLKQADLPLVLRPGTDGALACAVMHILFRDGYANREYLARYADDAEGLEAHLKSRGPEWAAAITGLSIQEIEAFAQLVGTTPKTFFRLGYGFTRQRNGTINMHAASCIPVVTGAWLHEGGGAFHNNAAIFGLNKDVMQGAANADASRRWLDQGKIGRILTGDESALNGGPPVTALFIQNTNPANVAPEQRLVIEGLKRDDLFTVVHEQFMTDTARYADVVLPATTFLEHDDVYKGGGHQHVLFGPKLIDAPGETRENLFVHEELAKRLGVADAAGFGHTAREHVDIMLADSGKKPRADWGDDNWIDLQPDFETSHFIHGFGHADGKFRFKPDWLSTPAPDRPADRLGLLGPLERLPVFPDHVDLNEAADATHPFKLATSPARNFLNSTFAETPTSAKNERRPELMMHPDDAAPLGVTDGARVEIGNTRAKLVLHARLTPEAKRGTVIAEGLWPNSAHERGEGINVLVGADSCAPYGGVAYHDVKVWIRGL
ncbi:MAG: molybdopterin-dependent oxidoreductase [Phyllobacteriaceae bacterium]|nr:molybdopterin-dependent oxidoreductase [Phyllobacteriaceae bacterium]